MPASQPYPGVIRFGVFELDVAAGELRRDGLKVKLQNQPVRVLTLLLKRAGEVVPRDDFREEIWPADTFVDFDRGLSTAINKIREALGDSADNPRFVETVPRRGYRFIAPVEGGSPAAPRGAGASAESPAGTEPLSSKPQAQPSDPEPRVKRRTWLWAAAVGVAFLVGFLGRDVLGDRGNPRENLTVRKSQIPLEEAGLVGRGHRSAISPDGTMVAVIDRGRLWIRELKFLESREVAGTEGAGYPFWSPDSELVGFEAGGSLRKVPAAGGPVTTLCDLPPGAFRGATWGANGSVVFAAEQKGLFEVPGQGGDPTLKLKADPAKGETNLSAPYFLPNSRTLLLVVDQFDPRPEQKIVALSESGRKEVYETKARTIDSPGSLAFSPSGHLIFHRGGSFPSVWALNFSSSDLAASGEPFRVENGAHPSTSSDGTLVYESLWQAGAGPHQLAWVDRSGKVLRTIGQPQGRMRRPAVSPDGREVAVTGDENGNDDIWVHDVARGTKRRFTFHADIDASPAWSPSGDRIAFDSTRSGHRDILVKAADGSGEAQPLVAGPAWEAAPHWSRDGKYLLYSTRGQETEWDQWYRPLSDEGDAEPFLQTPHMEAEARLSPDSRYVAYQSDESGRFEIYVTAFPSGEGKRLVSTGGGVTPKWSPRGGELFYVEGNSLMAVSVETQQGFKAGTPQRLFDGEQLGAKFNQIAPTYDVAADGQHFVVVQSLGRESGDSVIVVQNWFAEFEK